MSDYSEKFYARYAGRYAEVSHQLLQSIYIESSHPKLASDLDLIEHLKRPWFQASAVLTQVVEPEHVMYITSGQMAMTYLA